MNLKKILIVLLLIPVFLLISLAVYSFMKMIDRNEPVESDEVETELDVIKGPNVGENGNDYDNTFRSLTISHTNPDVVFIGNEGNGIFRTTDGGTTWEWIRTGLKHDEGRYPEVYDIAIDKDNESVLLAATTNGPSPIYTDEYDVPLTAGIYRSEDEGDTWHQYLDGLPNSAVVSLVQIPDVENTYVLGLDGLRSSRDSYRHLDSYGGLYISEDGGKSWDELPIPDDGIQNRYAKLKVRGTAEPVLFTSGVSWIEGDGHSTPDQENSIGLLRSDDYGKTWTRINPTQDSFILYFDVSVDGNTIYASDMINDGGTYVSHDQGYTWEEIPYGGFGPAKISPTDTNRVLFSAGNSLRLTEDGFGTHKEVLTAEGPINDIEYFEGDPDIVYVSTAGFKVYKSVDGGETFTQIANLREFIDNYD